MRIDLLSQPLTLLRRRGMLFGMILVGALMAFEVFNYSTTDFALRDLLGDLTFAGLRWATILSLAFCGIDFAGLARLFTPERGRNEPAEVWYLFGAWLLAAAMNALLTWWGVSVAILNHQAAGSALIGAGTLHSTVPVFVAVMVWLIRILIIGTFSVAGERIFSQADYQLPASPSPRQPVPAGLRPVAASPRPVPRPQRVPSPANAEPSYHPIGMSARASDEKRTSFQ